MNAAAFSRRRQRRDDPFRHRRLFARAIWSPPPMPVFAPSCWETIRTPWRTIWNSAFLMLICRAQTLISPLSVRKWWAWSKRPPSASILPLDVRARFFQRPRLACLARPFRLALPSVMRNWRQYRRAKAARAVAGACAANALAIAIPCHRVVRQDGALSGLPLGRRAQTSLA